MQASEVQLFCRPLFRTVINILKVEGTLVTLGGAIFFKVHMRRLRLILCVCSQMNSSSVGSLRRRSSFLYLMQPFPGH